MIYEMYSYYPIRRAREIAWYYTLPISLTEVCRDGNVELYFSDLDGIAACYMERHGKQLILVNDTASRERQRFSIAHELGHYALNHGAMMFTMTVEKIPLRPPQCEADANRFAAELLMPKQKLMRYGILTAKQISSICGVSLQTATIRARELGWS